MNVMEMENLMLKFAIIKYTTKTSIREGVLVQHGVVQAMDHMRTRTSSGL